MFLLQKNNKWQKMPEGIGGLGLGGFSIFGFQYSTAGLGALGHDPGHFTASSFKTRDLIHSKLDR